MKNIEVKKRPWVMTAAFIFMVVMFVLMFFSNTIMNRSLPEVAAQYTQAGNITARIRGSGTVSANESFSVTSGSTNTQTVKEVLVRLGDEVAVGDALLTLDQKSGSDLDIAKAELEKLELELEQWLIMSRPDVNYASLNRTVQRARDELTEAQRERAAISYNEEAFSQAKTAVDAARALEAAWQIELDIAIAALAAYDAINPGTLGEPVDTPERTALVKRVNTARSSHFDAWEARVRLEVSTNFFTQEANRALWIAANSRVISAQDSLDGALEALASQQRADGRESDLFNLTLREKNREIDAKRAIVTELEKEGSTAQITSLVSGRITQIHYTSGDTVAPEAAIITIEVTDRGYTLSIPVSAEQSTRVRIGDVAEADRGWWSWGNPISAVLTSIRTDPANPSTGRLLIFNIHGDDIESNTQLNITIAQRSENYGIIVPKNAVRSDTNGDFVLVVVSRNSPLGNRYVATRADVTVLASDDTHTAISGGGLTGWDFIITHSDRPIEPGMQVRLVDNP